jgi:hypothetical protein
MHVKNTVENMDCTHALKLWNIIGF